MIVLRTEKWFSEVFHLFYEPLRNYLYYLSGDMHWSEDTVQELFVIVWEKRQTLREETIKPFLYTIARNAFLKQKRHETVQLKFRKLKIREEEAIEIPDSLENEEFDRALQLAISHLPDKCRIVFLMSRIDDMNNKLIAVNLGVSVKAVEKQITKALKILKGKLEPFR
jgi:RNA polymerase sigma-70 factor (family 1)